MIPIHTRADQHLAVFGLGSSGLAVARALLAGGAGVTAWDDDIARRDAAAADGIPLGDWAGYDWSRLGALVLAPGVALTHPRPHPVVAAAQAAGRPVIGDIELMVEACGAARLIAVTGTNGKSTTTALIGHVLRQAGRPVAVGGNIGAPALELDRLGPDGTYVLELSSFQLDLTEHAAFDIAVMLNLTPDHLDRHGDMAGYAAAKRRIFRDRRAARAVCPRAVQCAIVGIDDEHGRQLATELALRPGWSIVPVSGAHAVGGGAYAHAGTLFDATEEGAPRRAVALDACPALPGAHNGQNAAAAFAACRFAGVEAATIARAFGDFPGLPHRQERVATIGGVAYVNDSKATNADAAVCALNCYGAVYWIAGGRAKDSDLGALAAAAGHIRRAYLIGEAAERIAAVLPAGVPIVRCGDLARALAAAHADAQAEQLSDAAVLLSPACASFDQWTNFAARGDAFRDRVRQLSAGTAR